MMANQTRRVTIEIYTGQMSEEKIRDLAMRIDNLVEELTGAPTNMCGLDNPDSAGISIHDSDTGEAVEVER